MSHSPSPMIDIDGALVAKTLGLGVDEFRQLMKNGKITVLCERGQDENRGRYRASFYYSGARARFIVDEHGRVIGQ